MLYEFSRHGGAESDTEEITLTIPSGVKNIEIYFWHDGDGNEDGYVKITNNSTNKYTYVYGVIAVTAGVSYTFLFNASADNFVGFDGRISYSQTINNKTPVVTI